MLSLQIKIPRIKKNGHLLPILPFIPQKKISMVEEKGKYIVFSLRTRVGQLSDETKDKKDVGKFEEVSLKEWIDMMSDLDKIWT
jgi:hypothetical protein